MDQRTRRSPARFLAPLALIAVLLAFFTIVNGSGESDTSGDDSSGTSAQTTTTSKSGPKSTTTSAKKKAKAKAKTYTVQVGDTLGGIADKTGVSLATLEELNPDVDPQAMVAGQKIKLE